MKLRLASFNMHFHDGYVVLPQLIQQHAIDLVCLQECRLSKLEPDLMGLQLLATGKYEFQTLAIYAKPSYSVARIEQIDLPQSIQQRIKREERDRLLVVELLDTVTQTPLVIANIHAVHLVALNSHRRKQIAYALQRLNTFAAGLPVMIAGDLNHPFGKSLLTHTFNRYRFTTAHNTTPTIRNKAIAGIFDYIAYGSTVRSAPLQVVMTPLSDHALIYSDLTF